MAAFPRLTVSTTRGTVEYADSLETSCCGITIYRSVSDIRDLFGGAPVITPILGAGRLRVGPRVASLSLLLLSAAAEELVGAGTPSILWNQPFGSTNNDYSTSVSADGLGNVYASGTTSGNVQGTNAGQQDAFIVRYDSACRRRRPHGQADFACPVKNRRFDGTVRHQSHGPKLHTGDASRNGNPLGV